MTFTADGKRQRLPWFFILSILSLNKSYKNRKTSLTIHSKYKCSDSTVQGAEDRRQKFHFCRLPVAVNVMLNLSILFFLPPFLWPAYLLPPTLILFFLPPFLWPAYLYLLPPTLILTFLPPFLWPAYLLPSALILCFLPPFLWPAHLLPPTLILTFLPPFLQPATQVTKATPTAAQATRKSLKKISRENQCFNSNFISSR